MPFSQRNLYYLRASPHVVMQMVLYLEPSNLRWMNAPLWVDEEDDEDGFEENFGRNEQTIGDDILKKVVAHLSNVIMPKLYKEKKPDGLLSSSNGKRSIDQKLDVDFMMLYFFRAIDKRHAILLKNKKKVFPQKREPMAPPLISATEMRNERVQQTTLSSNLPPSRLAERQTNEFDRHDIVAEGQDTESHTDDVRVKEEDVEMNFNFHSVDDHTSDVQEQQEESMPEYIDVDDLEDDKKPRESISYAGFQIFELALVLIIEPSKRSKKLRPELFQEQVQTEKHQLSATPIPDQNRSENVPTASPARNNARSSSRSQTNKDDQRADSRRVATAEPLFRGTPSDWEPTPTPPPTLPLAKQTRFDLPEDRDSAEGSPEDADDDDDLQMSETEEDPQGSRAYALARHLMEEDDINKNGRGFDDDDD